MTEKPTRRSDAMVKIQPAAPEVDAAGNETRTLTLRLAPAMHDQLREMAFLARRSQQSLLLEALNDLFQKHGKPPIHL